MEERVSVTLKNSDQKIFGMFHYPKNKKNVPAVLICHGLAGNKMGKHRVYVELANQLVEEGVASFRFDYRGCGDSEGVFKKITPSDHYSDAILAFNFLENHEVIDIDRIGVFGRSFGGVVALKAASVKPKVKSIALWCPMFNGKQWEHQWHLAQKDLIDEDSKLKLMQIDGQQGSMSFFQEFFSIDVSKDLAILDHLPFLHVHGENDTRVSLEHAQLYEKFRNNKDISKFIRLPNSDHDFSSIKERKEAIKITTNWFKETL